MEKAMTGPNEQRVSWRIGKSVPINVYEGDRLVCQCQTAIDAKRIVEAVNGEMTQALDRAERSAEINRLHEVGYKEALARTQAALDRVTAEIENSIFHRYYTPHGTMCGNTTTNNDVGWIHDENNCERCKLIHALEGKKC